MATTTNFGWDTPDDTDLVKDGAAAIRTLGNSIDSSFVDFKGGTTNQVLAKNSNTDLDFKWVADATGIPATIIDAKGDLIAGTAADTAGRLAVGANGTVLTADSGETTGIKWATPASGGMTLLSTTTLSGSSTTTATISSDYINLLVFIDDVSPSTTAAFRIATDSGTYDYIGTRKDGASETNAFYGSSGPSYIDPPQSLTSGTNCFVLSIDNYTSTKQKMGFLKGRYVSTYMAIFEVAFRASQTTAISTLTFSLSTGTFSGGTVKIYGVK